VVSPPELTGTAAGECGERLQPAVSTLLHPPPPPAGWRATVGAFEVDSGSHFCAGRSPFSGFNLTYGGELVALFASARPGLCAVRWNRD
jgi:hypothetical protein